MVECSKDIQKYFDELEKNCNNCYKIASLARKKGFDCEKNPEIFLAKNMAERVIGLISVIAPQLINSSAVERINELEKKYGVLDWRVAFVIAEEIAREKFCKFKDQKEAIEVGIRTGFAYVTVGVVSSPLEGFTSLEIKDRMDGSGKYFCLNFSGPIRNAGGTAASVCVLIADYLRVKFGYKKYDATDLEIKRCFVELEDYHSYVTNLQYFPSKEEIDFLLKNIPIEISGEASEKYEVSNYKDLPRIPTNKLRSGYCLLYSSCIPLKAAKLWSALKKWGKEFEMDDWFFLEEFLHIQKSAKALKKKSETTSKISPDYTYIKDLVAGRPVLGYPLKNGGFRLRYGRSRVSGYSAQSIHPATMHILNNYVAVATQLKVERPGKAAAITPCDSIDGPIVKLNNGNVLILDSEQLAKEVKNEINEILYLGDILVSYGDFFNRNHVLVPAGYCEEFWIKEFEKAALENFPLKNTNVQKEDLSKKNNSYSKEELIDFEKLSEYLNISEDKLFSLFKKPIKTKISFQAAFEISKKLNIPLHPKYTFFWKSISLNDLKNLVKSLYNVNIISEDNRIVKIILPFDNSKRTLELLGIPHLFVNKEFVVIESDYAEALLKSLNIHNILLKEELLAIEKIIEQEILNINLKNVSYDEGDIVLNIVNKISPFVIRDKAGVFIGSRMGRPEKAKMRKLTGQPHVLFPVGEEGGKLRSFQSALEIGKITSNFPIFYCNKCNRKTIFQVCDACGENTIQKYFCLECKSVDCSNENHKKANYANYSIDIKEIFNNSLKKLNTKIFPDLIKGIKGTVNENHLPEHLIKGILRSKHQITVNKDGTTRYDCSEIPITHFKPKEIFVNIDKLKKLGYEKDIEGKPLENQDQILELKPQDVIIPCCPDSPDESCDEVLFRTANFIDELLDKVYDLKPFYKLKSKEDLVGHLIIGLAPHTSAGILGRIIGFSKTQGFLAHPLFHAAMRRDADGDESCIFLLMDGFLNFSKHYLSNKRGSTMDAPLVLTYILNPAEVDDMVFDLDIAWDYPLDFYISSLEYKSPASVKINQLRDYIGTINQYEEFGFTHDTDNFNSGVLCSQYKLLPSMEDKLFGQMELAIKIRSVDSNDVAKLVIEKHFIRDIKGNLKKFSTQQFRCSNCNEKYRRPPLIGKCIKCNGKIIFTISEGSIIKYLEPTIHLAKKFNIPEYLKETIYLTKKRIEEYFGKEDEKQLELNTWFN